jgi:protein SCO1/2
MRTLTAALSATLIILFSSQDALAGSVTPADPIHHHVSPFPPGGDFQLISAKGPVTLAGMRGKAVILFFGYTSCPDVCPMSMHTVAQTYRHLNSDEQRRFQAVFVSVDPERDTPEILHSYTNSFNAPLVGVSGTPDQIAALAERYGAQYHRVNLPGSALVYAMDHSAALYLISPEGHLLKIFRHTAPPRAIAEAVKRALHNR